ncbi:threonine/serine dehydratase [Breoghania sp. L-A4]|uniref:threonine ammonia-lyase n=1 Tax=Breoghania sp. L-A4 TaxID=2304600 RepID=UPI000E35EE77|nr:threonine/serine dehydratase [Breoghania sp. L-A4]AXS41250.1 threonine/serine dehydratase [Breoghania sp. L-A4]
MNRLPGFSDVQAARARIAGHAVVTPLLRSDALDALTGGRILLKPECLQRTGTFKFRGAFNRLSMIEDADRPRGVVACSSGNHAQGVAEAARMLGMPATIVMPSDAPEMKRLRTEASGATVIAYDRESEDREAIAATLCSESGATLVHPYDDAGVMAGQGTAGLELIEQAGAMGMVPDEVLTPCGGGGLTAGLALALEGLSPNTRLCSVEPEGFEDTARSLAAHRRLGNERAGGSVCDALLSPMPGTLTFQINEKRLSQGLAVSDAEALAAVAYAFRELKLVLEPGGAVALAAVLSGHFPVEGKTVAVVLSGGNIEPAMMARALAG